jgi:uridine phosphorylase
MPYPNHPDKLSGRPVLTPQALIAYRRRLGSLPNIQPPLAMILCLQRGLPERLRRSHPFKRAGRLMGDLLLIRRSRAPLGVLTNIGIGSPSIAALAEELIAWGVKELVSFAWAGGLQPALPPGSIVICDRAIRDEGTSHHYLAPSRYVAANSELVDRLTQGFTRRGLAPRVGATWTTDAPYRETEAEVRSLQAEGVLTVEMEAAGLLAIGQARRVPTACVFAVGDSLADLSWRAPDDVRPVEQALEAIYAGLIGVLDRAADG